MEVSCPTWFHIMNLHHGSGIKNKLLMKNTIKYPTTSNASQNVELLTTEQGDSADTF